MTSRSERQAAEPRLVGKMGQTMAAIHESYFGIFRRKSAPASRLPRRVADDGGSLNATPVTKQHLRSSPPGQQLNRHVSQSVLESDGNLSLDIDSLPGPARTESDIGLLQADISVAPTSVAPTSLTLTLADPTSLGLA